MLWWHLRRLRSADPSTRKRAVYALAPSTDQRAQTALRPMLRDADNTVRWAAATAIGGMRNPVATDALLDALLDSDRNVARASAQSLDRLGWTAVRAADRAALLIAQRQFADIAQIGEAAMEPLAGFLGRIDEHVASGGGERAEGWAKAAATLCRIDGLEANAKVTEALRALKAYNEERRLALAKELGAVPTVCSVRVLIELLPHAYWTREAAQKSLNAIGSVAVEPLIAALQHGDFRVRQAAAEVLGQMRDPRAARPLVAALIKSPLIEVKIVEDNEHERLSILSALASLGGASAEPLTAALAQGDAQLVQKVMDLLRVIETRGSRT